MHYDVVIIGSGAGGATLAYALRDTGLKILVLERGDHLPREPHNWDTRAVFAQRRYHTTERWTNLLSGRKIRPKEFYWVGGKTKVYGSALLRLREQDFEELEHREGTSPAWPISYRELEPYYTQAESLFLVHGTSGADPCEPPRSGGYPFPALPETDYMHDLFGRLRRQGLQPFPIPLGIDYRPGGPCVYCRTCDGYPCHVDAKSDAEVRCLRPALASGNVTLVTRAYAQRLETNGRGEVTAVHVHQDGQQAIYRGRVFVVSCGAIQSAALLLRSACDRFPHGLANGSGCVGRHLMFHNATGLVAIHPLRRNQARFQKSLALTDFYFSAPDWPHPLGCVQLLGFYPLQYNGAPWIGGLLNQRSVQLFALSEDLPQHANHVQAAPDGKIGIAYRPTNLASHRHLVRLTRRLFRRAGFPIVVSQYVAQPKDAGAHECGTLRFGHDPRTSVLDAWCRAHEVPNLYAVDASFFPSSGAVNPALTIIAQALRVGQRIAAQWH